MQMHLCNHDNVSQKKVLQDDSEIGALVTDPGNLCP